jgi:uncharacterized membrane protein
MLNRFPNDRINNFCDAVFAIAMTLLILEIKIPTSEAISEGTWRILGNLIPSFTGFVISFLVTALYWRLHLTMAQFVKSYDNRLLWLNVWLLMSIVLLPFSTAFYAKGFREHGPFIFYCTNLVAIGLLNFFMLRYIVRKEGYNETITPLMVGRLRTRILIAPIIWAISAALEFVAPWPARFLFILIFIVQAISERRFDRKMKQATSTTNS